MIGDFTLRGGSRERRKTVEPRVETGLVAPGNLACGAGVGAGAGAKERSGARLGARGRTCSWGRRRRPDRDEQGEGSW